MKQYKEIRKIRASALRQLCIDHNWYTAGDNDEYEHLLFDLAGHKENLSTADIIEIAADIMEHSELDDDCIIESVAFEVARIADVFFEEALAETPRWASPGADLPGLMMAGRRG